MGFSLGDLGSFAVGAINQDKENTAAKLEERKEELKANRAFIIKMKENKYQSELATFEEENKKAKAIAAVNNKYKALGGDINPIDYGRDYILATNPTEFSTMTTLYKDNQPKLEEYYASFANKATSEFKPTTTRDALDAKQAEDIQSITAEFNKKIENARGDSFLINQIIGLKNKAINKITEKNKEGEAGTILAKEIQKEIETVKPEEADTGLVFAEASFSTPKVPKPFRDKVEPIRNDLNKNTEIKKENVNIALTFFNENDIAVPKQYLQIDSEGNTTGLKGPGLTFVNQTNALTSQAIQTITDEDIYANSSGKTSLISNSLNPNKVNGKVSERIANYSTTSQEKKVGYFNNRDNIIAVVPFSIVDSNNTLGGYQFTNKAQTKKVGEVYLQALKNIEATNNPKGVTERSQKYLNDFQNKLLRMDVNSTSKESEAVKTEMIRLLTEQRIIKPETTTTSTDGISQITTSSGVESIVIDGNNIPLTEKNKEVLESQGIDWKNQEKVNVPQKEIIKTKSGDMDVAEQVAKATTTNKITPKDIGQVNMPVFETLESILEILPSAMTGQEIMDKYEIAFPINKFTKYSPSK
jgi:hypothetical protein